MNNVTKPISRGGQPPFDAESCPLLWVVAVGVAVGGDRAVHGCLRVDEVAELDLMVSVGIIGKAVRVNGVTEAEV